MAKGSSVYVGFLGYGQSTAKYLPDFLASLRQQTFADLEIIDGDIGQQLLLLLHIPRNN